MSAVKAAQGQRYVRRHGPIELLWVWVARWQGLIDIGRRNMQENEVMIKNNIKQTKNDNNNNNNDNVIDAPWGKHDAYPCPCSMYLGLIKLHT